MEDRYQNWITEVRKALQSINMSFDDWQKIWEFDFASEYSSGTEPIKVADKANRFWWREQNKSLHQECLRTLGCWLPRNHNGECQLVEDGTWAHS